MRQYAKHIGPDNNMKWRRVTRAEESRKAGNRQGNKGDRDWEREKGCFCLVAPEIHCSPHQSWRADEIVPAQREPHGSHVQSWHKSCWQGIEVDYIVQINCCLNLPLFLLARGGLGTWVVYCLVLIAFFVLAHLLDSYFLKGIMSRISILKGKGWGSASESNFWM